MKKIKLTALERSWILYDIGNSAFILLVSTLIPIYFNSLATAGGLNESLYLSYWGYAGSVSTLLVAVIGPICGTLADHRGFKKPIFMVCMLLGVLGCAAMGVTGGMAGISGGVRSRQSGVFLQSGVLRRHAPGGHH